MTATLRTDLDDFLFAPVAQGANGMPLTVASVLARLDFDPWAEAADLADLSREAATEKLIALLAGVPNGPSPGADTATLASHLVALLHPAPKPRVSTAAAAQSRPEVAPQPRRVKLAIYYLLALIFMLVGHWVMTHPGAPTPTDTSQSTSP
jgi:hypothetical protein